MPISYVILKNQPQLFYQRCICIAICSLHENFVKKERPKKKYKTCRKQKQMTPVDLPTDPHHT